MLHAISPLRVPPFRGQDLQLELIDSGSLTLIRSYKHPDADLNPPPEEFRNSRVDPPDGFRGAFSVMYTSSNIQSSAMEVRALYWDHHDQQLYWDEEEASLYRVVRFQTAKPAIFIPIDGSNRAVLGLDGKLDLNHESSRWVGLELFRRYGHLVHGVSYESFHRHQPGRVYAIWHSRKGDLELSASEDRPILADDQEAREMLDAHPFIARVSQRPNSQLVVQAAMVPS